MKVIPIFIIVFSGIFARLPFNAIILMNARLPDLPLKDVKLTRSQTPLQDAPIFGGLSLELENIQSDKGKIHVALYDREEAFSQSLKPYRLLIKSAPGHQKLRLQIDSLPYGRYALAVYQDENDNGDLDKNLLGIPKEPYGFSHNPRAKWNAPDFSETAFELNAKPTKLSVNLKKWKDR